MTRRSLRSNMEAAMVHHFQTQHTESSNDFEEIHLSGSVVAYQERVSAGKISIMGRYCNVWTISQSVSFFWQLGY